MIYTVLGASGFIGRNLVNALQNEGHTVYAPHRDSIDLFNRPLGHVLYCIGLTADFRTRPFDTVRAHVSVLADVLERCDFESFVYLSSTRVYARVSSGFEQTPILVDPLDPTDLYNISKLAGESLCRGCGRANVRVARVSNVIGHDPASNNFVSSLIREALSGTINLRSHPDSSKDYILLEDVVSLLPRIAAEGKESIYNVASGINISHNDVTSRLAQLSGCAITICETAPLLSFPVIDITPIRSEFAFSPASVLDALPRLLSAYRPGTP